MGIEHAITFGKCFFMQHYDVALWLTPFSWWPDYVAFVHADAASLAVVQLMRTYSLQRVFKAAVTASEGTRQRWWNMKCSAGHAEREFA
jgi:hypothetical protein